MELKQFILSLMYIISICCDMFACTLTNVANGPVYINTSDNDKFGSDILLPLISINQMLVAW